MCPTKHPFRNALLALIYRGCRTPSVAVFVFHSPFQTFSFLPFASLSHLALPCFALHCPVLLCLALICSVLLRSVSALLCFCLSLLLQLLPFCLSALFWPHPYFPVFISPVLFPFICLPGSLSLSLLIPFRFTVTRYCIWILF